MTSEILHKSDMIIIDRRGTARGKSLPNRERLLERIRDAIRNSDPHSIGNAGVKASGASSTSSASNPVQVARSALHEPTFHYASHSGRRIIVLIGNKQWDRGDEIPIRGEDDEEGGGEGGAGDGEDGEDEFIVNISSDEFYRYYFEDCKLPNMHESSLRVVPEEVPSHAGFQKSGNPAQLSIIRSYKNSLGRRNALTRTARTELAELEKEYEEYGAGTHDQCQYLKEDELVDIMTELLGRIEALRRKIAATPFFEELDLRFIHREHQQVKKADAAFFMLMDVSGSMDEMRKRIARRMFTLQYVFIKRTYPDTDLVFISHTSTPEEVTEEEFFKSQRSGGTMISPAYQMAIDIINTRYDPNLTNIYLSHASDSDNWEMDNTAIEPMLMGTGLLQKLRHMVYFHVGYGSGMYGARTFLELMKRLSKQSDSKLQIGTIEDESSVFAVFKQIYGVRQGTV